MQERCIQMNVAAEAYAQFIPDTPEDTQSSISDLQRTMLNATPDCIKILSTDGRLLMMNRAGCLALNVPESSNFGMPWLSLLPEEVRTAAQAEIDKAASGQTSRFPGKSLSAQGSMYWDNLLTPIMDVSGKVTSILCVSRDVTEKTLLAKRVEEAIQREKLISREMHHRIKNILSLVTGLVFISEKEARINGQPEKATTVLQEKIEALSRASDAVFAECPESHRDKDPVDLETVISATLKPYGECCTISGERISIRHDALSVFVLFLHELATNSVKYGALGHEEGRIAVNWRVDNSKLVLTWSESGGPVLTAAPERSGFGNEMIDRIARSAGGCVGRTWNRRGLTTDLTLPCSLCTHEPETA